MSLFILDSGHTHSVAQNSEQTQWLKAKLQERKKIALKFAVYHVPAYPSVRSTDGKRSRDIRKAWVPLFEKYGLLTAFEHHDHVYKRTYRIKKDKKNSAGVLYMGDGCWGVAPRVPRTPSDIWYLAKTAAERHFVLVSLTANESKYMAISAKGRVIDELREPR